MRGWDIARTVEVWEREGGGGFGGISSNIALNPQPESPKPFYWGRKGFAFSNFACFFFACEFLNFVLNYF